MVPSPLCPHQQIKGLHAQVMRTLWFEQNATQQVGGDVCGGIVTGLQQVRQELQSSLWVVLFDGGVNQAQALVTQRLWSSQTFFFSINLKKEEEKTCRTFSLA